MSIIMYAIKYSNKHLHKVILSSILLFLNYLIHSTPIHNAFNSKFKHIAVEVLHHHLTYLHTDQLTVGQKILVYYLIHYNTM